MAGAASEAAAGTVPTPARSLARALRAFVLAAALLWLAPGHADHDPEPRANLEMGVAGPLRGDAPLTGYAFFLWNRPHFPAENQYFRLVIAPTYLLADLIQERSPEGRHAFGLGVRGGGFRYGHEEFRDGRHRERESFWGHGVELPLSYYAGGRIADVMPIEGQVRLTPAWITYQRSGDTAERFALPPDTGLLTGRVGLRVGGVPPVLLPDLALEASLWHETTYRSEGGGYGLPGRPQDLEHVTQRTWARLGAVLTPADGHTVEVLGTAGFTGNADALSSFRLGSALPFRSELPLLLRGYYVEEVLARRFWLLNASYRFPAWPGARRVRVRVGADYAYVDYLAGHRLPRRHLRGVGADVSVTLTRRVTVVLGYGYGIDAPRDGGFGGHEANALIELRF